MTVALFSAPLSAAKQLSHCLWDVAKHHGCLQPVAAKLQASRAACPRRVFTRTTPCSCKEHTHLT